MMVSWQRCIVVTVGEGVCRKRQVDIGWRKVLTEDWARTQGVEN